MKPLVEGEPCGHPGCLSHATIPCQKCGRRRGRMEMGRAMEKVITKETAALLEQIAKELWDEKAQVLNSSQTRDLNGNLDTVLEIRRESGSLVTVREVLSCRTRVFEV